MPRPKEPREHGTRKGYRQHLRDRTEPCDPCREAERKYQTATRETRRQKGTYKSHYTPFPPAMKPRLNPAMVEAWFKGNERAATELQEALRASLRAWKEANDREVMKERRKAWRASDVA